MCACVCGGVCTCACVCGVCVSLVPRRSGGGAKEKNACLCMRLISEKIGYFSDLPRNFYANFIAGSVHAVK